MVRGMVLFVAGGLMVVAAPLLRATGWSLPLAASGAAVVAIGVYQRWFVVSRFLDRHPEPREHGATASVPREPWPGDQPPHVHDQVTPHAA